MKKFEITQDSEEFHLNGGKMADWKDIDSAPKDGTKILCCWESGSSWIIQPVTYNRHIKQWCVVWDHNEVRPTFWTEMPESPNFEKTNKITKKHDCSIDRELIIARIRVSSANALHEANNGGWTCNWHEVINSLEDDLLKVMEGK